tara:strand:+ start:97 stop:639 length:543 start_codon:yes stop_codon:yes gene_type:complete
MAFKMKNENLGKATRQAGKPESRRTESPVKFDFSSALDKVGIGLTGLGMIPAVGNIADAANTALSAGRAGYAKYKGDENAYKKHRNEAAINAAAMIPGAGLAVGAGKLAVKGAKAVKAGKTAEKVTKEGGKLAAKTGKKAVVGKTKEEANKQIDKKPSKTKPSNKKITIKKDKPKKLNLA